MRERKREREKGVQNCDRNYREIKFVLCKRDDFVNLLRYSKKKGIKYIYIDEGLISLRANETENFPSIIIKTNEER